LKKQTGNYVAFTETCFPRYLVEIHFANRDKKPIIDLKKTIQINFDNLKKIIIRSEVLSNKGDRNEK